MAARLVVLTLLAGVGFFNFHNLIPLPLQRVGLMVMLMVCLLYGVKEHRAKLSDYDFPKGLWLLFLILLVLSNFMAAFYHPQSVVETFRAQSTVILVFFSFFILLKLAPEPSQLIRYFYYLSAASILVYIINLKTFPNNAFGEPVIEDLTRGVLRIGISLFPIMMLLIFYSINRWTLERKPRWLIYTGIGFIMVLASLTRQVYFIMGVLVFFQLLQRVSWVKKIVLGIVLALTAYVVFINLPMYKDMKELSEEQLDQTTNTDREDVRIGAWRYYAWEGHEDMATFLFGNGMPSADKSVWGKFYSAFSEETGWYEADVSWAGAIYFWGIIATLTILSITLIAIFKKKPPEKQYLNYFLIAAILKGIASGTWFFPNEIVVTMIALYLVYAKPEAEIQPSESRQSLLSLPLKRPRTFVTR